MHLEFSIIILNIYNNNYIYSYHFYECIYKPCVRYKTNCLLSIVCT